MALSPDSSAPARPCRDRTRTRHPHHGISSRSRKNLPVSSSGASVASRTAVSAPSSTDRGAVGPPISVRTQPGHVEFTAILSPCRALASMRVSPLSASFESGVDADSLTRVRELSADSGGPYRGYRSLAPGSPREGAGTGQENPRRVRGFTSPQQPEEIRNASHDCRRGSASESGHPAPIPLNEGNNEFPITRIVWQGRSDSGRPEGSAKSRRRSADGSMRSR